MVKQECTYHPNFEIKCFREYINGMLIEEMYFNDKGDKHGTYRGWYPNGQLEFSVTFENGYKHGNLIKYFENGKIQSVREYVHGNSKQYTQYSEDGTEFYTQIFTQNGLSDSLNLSFRKQ